VKNVHLFCAAFKNNQIAGGGPEGAPGAPALFQMMIAAVGTESSILAAFVAIDET
jgi:hypothetical protein